MTEPETPAAVPVLVHAGVYTLWETPDGGRRLVFKRLHARDPATGQAGAIPEPQDEALPHVPAEALPLLSMWLDNGFPPAILAMLKAGQANPLAMIKQLRDMAAAVPADEASDGT